MKNAIFYLGFGFLATHELDAMPNHEWRSLPLLRALPDETGMLLFVVGHIPLFAVLVALVASSNPRTRRFSRLGIAAFLLLHGVGHQLSSGQAGYEFSSGLSSVLIFGGAVLGAGVLILEGRDRLRGGEA